MLTSLGAATEQDDQRVAIFGEINSVTGSPVDDLLTHAVKPLDAGRIAQLHTKLGDGHLGGCLRCQAVKPLLVRAGCIFANVFFDIDRHVL